MVPEVQRRTLVRRNWRDPVSYIPSVVLYVVLMILFTVQNLPERSSDLDPSLEGEINLSGGESEYGEEDSSPAGGYSGVSRSPTRAVRRIASASY